MRQPMEELLQLENLIDKHREKLELTFDFIAFSHDEGDIDFTDHAFNHEGTLIINPFLDITARYSVNPVVYYGNEFTNSKMADVIINYCKWND